MKHTILLADDSVTIQKVVELTFLDEDVRVVSVGNGSDAIARLEEVQPDLILADVHMPGADGYEVCSTAARVVPGVPVLLLVGTFEVFDPERSAQVGAVGQMKKPFDSQELLRRVRELLAAGPTLTAAGSLAEGARPIVAAPEPIETVSTVEPPAWEPEEPAHERSAAGAADEGESWSFEPVGEPEPESQAAAPATSAASDGRSLFSTSRFESPIAVHAPPPEPIGERALDAEPTPFLAREPFAEPVRAVAAAPVAEPVPTAVASAPALSDADLERLARRVAELLSERSVKEVAWEVVPDLAEVLLKARIRELEAAVE
jgi:CheY-like chemotaxis protein